MINKWILNNFKSIEGREELEFRPLTIFTGANSSGKSTILQSILLVSQTLQSSIVSRSIVLNGGIKKFGSYGDIVYRRQWKKDLSVGFEVTREDYDQPAYFSPWDEEVKGVSCQFTVGAMKEDDLQPYLKKMLLSAESDGNKESTMTISRIECPSDKVKKIVETMSKQPDPEDLNYSINAKASKNFSPIFDGGLLANTIGVSLSHFLPGYSLTCYNVYDRISEMLFERFSSYLQGILGMIDDSVDKLLSEALREPCVNVADELNRLAQTHTRLKNKKKFESAFEQYNHSRKFSDFVTLFHYCEIPIQEKAPLSQKMKAAIEELPPRYVIHRTPSHFIPGVDFVRELFRDHIWYLGPLREEPKAVYPLESDGSMNDVGYKGENTAAVYDYNKTKMIDFIAPSAFDNPKVLNYSQEICTLEDAIARWLVYLGVANDIVTDDRGKIGHELKISTDIKDMKQDLTHVGVGVSQVLPILVMSLLAQKGDVIILEQPELHLHPKVQTRLADFFVTMNALGKQCLIETHSEYLINRLRYLVAINETDKVAKDTMIYFVTKENMRSVYKPVIIDNYGAIDDWPDGFFDESENLAEAVLRAGYEKRKKELATATQTERLL